MTHFLFTPSTWLGTGTIRLGTAAPLTLHTRWTIEANTARQEVEIVGVPRLLNVYTISSLTPTTFAITLTNDTVQKLAGTGTITTTAVSWQFNHPELEGFENFDLQPDDTYLFQAEFGTVNQFCNQIEGKLWRSA